MERPRTLGSYLRALALYRGRLLAMTALIALAALGFKGWRLYTRIQALREDVRAIETIAPTKPDAATLASLGPLLTRTHGDAVALRAEATPLFPITRRLGWVPVYGPDLIAAEPLLDLAVELTTAADESFSVLAPVVLDRAQPISVALTRRVLTARPQLESAQQAITRAAEAWNRIPLDGLSVSLRDPLKRVGPVLPLARDGIDLALLIPDLLGAHGRRDYLLIAQNPDELRATGGLITGAGTLTFDDGRLVDLSIGDSVAVDNLAAGPYPSPPEPLLRYMGIQLWVFRDSNWSPDFPTSARTAMDLYKLGQRRTVSGVIAFDPAAIQLLLTAIGPVSVEGIPEPITAENVVPYMRNVILYTHSGVDQASAAPWWLQRKAFMAPLARAMIAKIESGPANVDLLALARATQRILDERHMLIAVQHSGAAAILARRGWDGAVQPGVNDFLMLVDSNLGYNKVNAQIRQEATYLVDLSDLSAPTALLSVQYTHRLNTAVACDQARGFETIITIRRYEELMVGCYWDYLRVLIPGGSHLVAATVQPIPGEWLLSGIGDDGAARLSAGEAGTEAVQTFFVLPPATEHQIVLRYRLPAAVLSQDAQGWHYYLRLQKQAGTDSIPIAVNLRLPPTAAISSTSSTPTMRIDQTLSFGFTLNQDQQLEVNFRIP